jgi:cellobiose phosphorylase
LIGHADWNDAIDAAGIKLKGESTWLAMALVRSLNILAELAVLIGKQDKADELLHKASTMTDRINELTWDGSWYKRGFTDDGTVYGSKVNKEGKIYINAQSWSILSGVADKDKQKKLLKSVDKHLDGEHGIALFAPAYSKWDTKLGRISMFAEGTKENAAVFCHAVTFQIVAECMAGRGTQAYKGMKKIMPSRQKDYDLYKTEPYVYAEYLIGPGHPYLYGEGAFTWITGNAGWNFIAATEWLLGARREYDGLRIDPCIPKAWKKCKIIRPFRSATYEITIKNPKGVEKGVKRITVDGQELDGTLIYPHSDNKVHKVDVFMG